MLIVELSVVAAIGEAGGAAVGTYGSEASYPLTSSKSVKSCHTAPPTIFLFLLLSPVVAQ